MQKIVSNLLQQWNLHPYTWNLLLIVGSFLLGLLLSLGLSLLVKRKTEEQNRFLLGQSLLQHLSMPLSILIPLFVFENCIPLLQVDAAIRFRVTKTAEIALIITFAWFLVRCIRVGQDFVHYKLNIHSTNNLRQRQLITQLIYIRRVAVFIILLLTVGAVLLSFDTMRKIGTGLLTGVGIGGIIIGFAAQRSLASFLAGFQIAFTQPIRIDDEVIVEGEFGKVEELTLTYVVVRLWDSRRMILPINYFIEKPFQNWTRTSSEILATVFIYADYSLPVDWLRQQFTQLVENHPLWDGRVSGVAVTDLKKDVMEIRGLVSAASSGNAFDLRCYLRENLVKLIQETYPQSLPKTRITLADCNVKRPVKIACA